MQDNRGAKLKATSGCNRERIHLPAGEQNISNLKDITRRIVEAFKVWRAQRIMAHKCARGATSVALDVAILHKVFAYALDAEMILKNPVKMEGRPGGEPLRGAQPFTGNELRRMRIHAGADLLIFLLLRHTGFRGSDAVGITWAEVHFDRREIERVTQKRRKLVVLPIHPELLFVLEAEYLKRNPKPHERVLLNRSTGNPLRRPRLYARTLALGKRAGVGHAHPHRFRDTLAVDLLCAGAGIYDLARILGDTIENDRETLMRHSSLHCVTECEESWKPGMGWSRRVTQN